MGRPAINEELYVDLLNSIVGGEFPPNSNLPTEATLSQRYGVSRSTVRAALSRLKEEGHVVSRQGSGSFVVDRPRGGIKPFTPIESLADLERCFECRISLEGEIAYYVAMRRDEADLQRMDQHAEAMARLLERGELHTSEDTDWHLWLAKASRNYFFESIMISIRPHILFGMNIIKTVTNVVYRRHAQLSLDEHNVIIDAIRLQDADGAREAMRSHLARSRRRIFEGN